MKKIIIIVTAALMIFACGGDRGKGHTKVNQESRKFIFDSLLAGSFNGNDLQWSLEGIDRRPMHVCHDVHRTGEPKYRPARLL